MQVIANGCADLAEHGDAQIGVDVPLVELIEDDTADAFEEWVVDELAGEDAFGQDGETGIRPIRRSPRTW